MVRKSRQPAGDPSRPHRPRRRSGEGSAVPDLFRSSAPPGTEGGRRIRVSTIRFRPWGVLSGRSRVGSCLDADRSRTPAVTAVRLAGLSRPSFSSFFLPLLVHRFNATRPFPSCAAAAG